MPVRPRLLHRMDLVSFRNFRKNLGNLREFFGQMVYRPPWQKIARTPMRNTVMITQIVTLSNTRGSKYKKCKKKINPGLALIGLSGTGPRLISSSNDGLLVFTV